MPVTDEIQSLILAQFDAAQSADVIRLLEQYGSENSEAERVHAAVLELAKGDFNQIQDLVNAAVRDYRDVLYWLTFDADGNPPPLPNYKTDNSAKIPPEVTTELIDCDVKLAVLESPKLEPQEVAINPTHDEIKHHVHRLPWNEITFVIASIDDHHWLEGSGSLKPEDGLSSVCCIGGIEHVIRDAPKSLDEIVALLDSFAQKNGKWRTMAKWC